jgi:flap endonuclease-1
MGVKISELLVKHEISIEELGGKKLAVDAFNTLYQFLTTIRQRDGTPLMDSKGNITSHLAGLFSRTTKLMEYGLKLAFVFDGEPPELKAEESQRRRGLKEEAKLKHKEAVEKENIEEMKKYASRISYLNDEMIEESKELISSLGLPIVQAPSEGEAQASYMVKKGEVWGIVSQDADSLLFGAENIVRNLSIEGRRKKAGAQAYTTVQPELVVLSENLKHLGISQDQLIVLALLIGTDYNIGGVKGLGPKKGLKLVKKYGDDFEKLFKNVEWEFPFSWKEPFNLIKKMPVTHDYKLKWQDIDEEKVIEILCKQHDFSKERVLKKIENLVKQKQEKEQTGLKK